MSIKNISNQGFSLFFLGSLAFVLLAGCTRPPETSVFYGSWENQDEYTRGITRFNVTRGDWNIFVQMWGRCSPEDCDWGETKAKISEENDNVLTIVWETDVRTRHHTLSYLQDGRLQLDSVVILKGYPDTKPTPYTYFFVKEENL